VTAIREILERARRSSRPTMRLSHEERNAALDAIARAIEADTSKILEANARDIKSATELPEAMKDRLRLDPDRLAAMVRAVDEVRALPDPLGGRRSIGTGRSGIRVLRQSVPLGVIAIVYEARPNVTAECAALTLKSGNVVILRGGKEAIESNRAIGRAIRRGLHSARVDEDAAILIEELSHDAIVELLGAVGLVDLVIPRGGPKLMALVDAHARVPVIRHGQGICHVYVDEDADPSMGSEIAFNAKVQRPGVCNAMETLLVHRAQLEPLLAALGPRLAERGVEIRADPASKAALAKAGVRAVDAEPKDFETEFLDLILAVKAVDGLDEALDHIAAHGTHHTASIVTKDAARAERFLNEVDASCVLWNASTRFNDGGELGLGAEMGISTSKMHAYGPMSVAELTAEKLVVLGDGQVRR
jgi:glutamate-5-semialdehyde dehydrogenase